MEKAGPLMMFTCAHQIFTWLLRFAQQVRQCAGNLRIQLNPKASRNRSI